MMNSTKTTTSMKMFPTTGSIQKKTKYTIENYRQHIDEIDEFIVSVLVDRFASSKNIGLLKKENNIDIIDNNRWDKVISRIVDLTKKYSSDEDKDFNVYVIKTIYDFIHKMSCKIQEQIFEEDE